MLGWSSYTIYCAFAFQRPLSSSNNELLLLLLDGVRKVKFKYIVLCLNASTKFYNARRACRHAALMGIYWSFTHTLHKKWSFPLRIFSVNVIKSEKWKTSFFVQWYVLLLSIQWIVYYYRWCAEHAEKMQLIWSHLLNKSLMANFIFLCSVSLTISKGTLHEVFAVLLVLFSV